MRGYIAPASAPGVLAMGAAGAAEGTPQVPGWADAACPLVPAPKTYQATGELWSLGAPASVAIVLGKDADEPEEYAAERFQASLLRKTGAVYQVCREGSIPAAAAQLMLLGQPSTHAMLRTLCQREHLELSAESPGHDGFVIEMIEEPGRQVVAIGGSNARGVIYGQAAFADLLAERGAAWVFPRVSVRDWPGIPWRAFTQNNPQTYLEPGRLDRYVDARLNFIELRDGPPPRRGHFGIPADFALDEGACRTLLREAHRRGFFVYGVVFCGVKPDLHDAVLRQFQQMSDLGVDGLYVSFDDPGGGEGQDRLVERVVEFGRQKGYTGHRLGTVPPGECYQHVDRPFNRKLAAIPGFAAGTWFFTSVPTAADAEAAERIGLAKRHGWWHNWPMNGCGGLTLLPGYLPMLKLEAGWGKPGYETLRQAPNCIDSALVWGGGYDEYRTRAFGFWAWDPERHDWPATQRAAYGCVFGPGLVEEARRLDDALLELIALCRKDGRGDLARWVIHLADPQRRPDARRLVQQMEVALGKLEAGAPAETSLSEERLLSQYLVPMRNTVHLARRIVETDFPDYTLSRAALAAEIKGLIEAGKADELRCRLAEVSERVTPMLQGIGEELRDAPQTGRYLSEWQQLLNEESCEKAAVSGCAQRPCARCGWPCGAGEIA